MRCASACGRSRCRRRRRSAPRSSVEIAGLRARIAQLDLAESGSRRAEAVGAAQRVPFAKRGAQGRLEGLLADRARAEEESRTRPAVARRPLLPAIGCRAARAARAAGGVGLGAARAFPGGDSAGRGRWDGDDSPRSSSRPRARQKPRARPSGSAPRSPNARRSSASGSARSSRRSPSRKAFRPPLARSPRTVRGSRSPRSTSLRATSAPSLPRCVLARRRSSPTIPPSGSRSSSALAPPASGASRCSRDARRRIS